MTKTTTKPVSVKKIGIQPPKNKAEAKKQIERFLLKNDAAMRALA